MAGKAGDVQAVFERYDRNHSGAIEVEELRALLADLGLKTSDSFVVAQFAAADADRDSKLSLEEFVAYYAKVGRLAGGATSGARLVHGVGVVLPGGVAGCGGELDARAAQPASRYRNDRRC